MLANDNFFGQQVLVKNIKYKLVTKCDQPFMFWFVLVLVGHMYVTKYKCSVLDTEVLRQDDSGFVF